MRTVRSVIRGGLALLLVAVALGLASAPARAEALTGAASLSARFATTCVSTADHKARCWGNNDDGQLGHGDNVDHNRAVLVRKVVGAGALLDVAQVSVGDTHACARLTSGQAACWGDNEHGQLGDGTTTGSNRPVMVRNGLDSGPLTGVAQLSAGADHTCARLVDGRVACWGDNSDGQAGGGGGATHTLPALVLAPSGTGALDDVAQVSAGGRSTCVRRTGGQARCWGSNGFGQLGDDTHTPRVLPVPVVGTTGSGRLTGIAQIAVADTHVCARLTSGQARCWGLGDEGELADGAGSFVSHPVVVVHPNGGPLHNVKQVAAGPNHTCFRLTSGRVRCSGYNGDGRLGHAGTPDVVLAPVFVRNRADTGALGGAVQVTAGNLHTCIRTAAGQVACWGGNWSGALGDGSESNQLLPVGVQV
jgi:alpha-tubulin suppressor-like RCC1 family protein